MLDERVLVCVFFFSLQSALNVAAGASVAPGKALAWARPETLRLIFFNGSGMSVDGLCFSSSVLLLLPYFLFFFGHMWSLLTCCNVFVLHGGAKKMIVEREARKGARKCSEMFGNLGGRYERCSGKKVESVQ